jgi:hypothetical protein
VHRVKHLLRSTLACLALLVVAACASGPTFTELQASTPAPAADGGRIYVYRTSTLGAAIQPAVKLDGVVIGEAKPRGYFYVDRPPGSYKISTETEVDRFLSLTLAAGQTRYVRLDPTFGFFVGHISPALVDQQHGQDEIKDCHYTGNK